MQATWKLKIGREAHHGVMVLTVTGRLGSRNSGRLFESVRDTVRDGYRDILVNLEGVDYMSSAGLEALDKAADAVHQAGGDVVLCGVQEPVRLVLDMAGLGRELDTQPSVQTAIERLRHISAAEKSGKEPPDP